MEAENVAVRKVKTLPAAARQAVQNLLGRKLKDEEQVSIRISSPHPAPPPEARRASAERLENIMDRAAEKAKHVPKRALNRLIDEALEHVRPRKKR